MDIGTRRAGLNIAEILANFLGFSYSSISRVYTEVETLKMAAVMYEAARKDLVTRIIV